MRFAMAALLLLAACDRGQMAESDQTVIAKQAKAYEAAADADVDQSIARLAQEAFEDGESNQVTAP